MKRGVSRSSRNAKRDAVDADVSTTNDTNADGEVVWSWRAHAGAKFGGDASGASRGRRWQTLVHRGEYEVSRKPPRREGRSVSACTCGHAPFAQFFWREGPGCSGHPAFPAPSAPKRDDEMQDSDAIGVAGMRTHASPLVMPATGPARSAARRQAPAGIQYTAASPFSYSRLWNTGSPGRHRAMTAEYMAG